MVEINRTEVRLNGDLPTVMSEIQYGLIALYDALKQHYDTDGDGDGLQAFLAYMAVVDRATQLIFQKDQGVPSDIKEALDYKEALDEAINEIKS